eukprot:6276544-Amphidinium_carterae.1
MGLEPKWLRTSFILLQGGAYTSSVIHAVHTCSQNRSDRIHIQVMSSAGSRPCAPWSACSSASGLACGSRAGSFPLPTCRFQPRTQHLTAEKSHMGSETTKNLPRHHNPMRNDISHSPNVALWSAPETPSPHKPHRANSTTANWGGG